MYLLLLFVTVRLPNIGTTCSVIVSTLTDTGIRIPASVQLWNSSLQNGGCRTQITRIALVLHGLCTSQET
jgi:hypothetical protein